MATDSPSSKVSNRPEDESSQEASEVRPVATEPVAPAASTDSSPSDLPLSDVGAGEEEEQAGKGFDLRSRFVIFNAVPSWMVSMVIHAVGILVLALLIVPAPDKLLKRVILAAFEEAPEEIEEFQEDPIETLELSTELTDSTMENMEVTPLVTEIPTEITEVTMANDVDIAAVKIDLSEEFSEKTAPQNDLLSTIGAVTGSGMAGRGSAKARQQLVKQVGGNKASEDAVAAALRWLAEHQLPNGAWSFDHRIGACQGRCSHQGRLDQAFSGATAMALLPFLGAGQTHKSGQYKETVRRGLYFLTSNIKVRPGPRGEFTQGGGSMYSHGLAAICLCEAFAMTEDRSLMGPAQLAINHIVYAQDPVGGGWRYQPRTPGDTSVVGWQLMALKSGHMAYLIVPPQTVAGASKFLDFVQADSGARYGYTNPGGGAATTAVGLLCRMYLGWKKDHAALERGVDHLAKLGPMTGANANMYFNYYATQVMRHYEGEKWDAWNVKMRDWLVDSQSKDAHEAGSWFVGAEHGTDAGGRLYCTSMATMILEVYYRHMPIYGKEAAEEEFPL